MSLHVHFTDPIDPARAHRFAALLQHHQDRLEEGSYVRDPAGTLWRVREVRRVTALRDALPKLRDDLALDDAGFEEKDHPRDKGGKFTDGSGTLPQKPTITPKMGPATQARLGKLEEWASKGQWDKIHSYKIGASFSKDVKDYHKALVEHHQDKADGTIDPAVVAEPIEEKVQSLPDRPPVNTGQFESDPSDGNKEATAAKGAGKESATVLYYSEEQVHILAIRSFCGEKITEEQSLGILKQISEGGGDVGNLPTSRFLLRETETSGLTDVELLKILDEKGYTNEFSYSSMSSYTSDYMQEVTSEEGQRAILQMWKDMPANDRIRMRRRRSSWSNDASRSLRGDILDEMADAPGISDEEKSSLMMFSSDFETARSKFFGSWSMTGGTTAYRRAYSALNDFDGNVDKEFWGGNRPLTESEKIPSGNLRRTLERLYQETQAFYKEKFKTEKTVPELKIRRGVGGHFDSYSPAQVESWTIDGATPARFGKRMAVNKKYSILSAAATYDHVLFSYETAAGIDGWPEEAALKGKKEFVILGGGLQNLTVERN